MFSACYWFGFHERALIKLRPTPWHGTTAGKEKPVASAPGFVVGSERVQSSPPSRIRAPTTTKAIHRPVST